MKLDVTSCQQSVNSCMNFRDFSAPNLGTTKTPSFVPGPGTNCKAWRFASNCASLLPRVARRGVHVVHKTCHRQIWSENIHMIMHNCACVYTLDNLYAQERAPFKYSQWVAHTRQSVYVHIYICVCACVLYCIYGYSPFKSFLIEL